MFAANLEVYFLISVYVHLFVLWAQSVAVLYTEPDSHSKQVREKRYFFWDKAKLYLEAICQICYITLFYSKWNFSSCLFLLQEKNDKEKHYTYMIKIFCFHKPRCKGEVKNRRQNWDGTKNLNIIQNYL